MSLAIMTCSNITCAGGGSPCTPAASADLLERCTAPANSPLPLPRMLVVLAHPDDEVLVLGGRLERLRASRLLCVTNGAPENGLDAKAHGFSTPAAYADARRAELDAALELAHVPASCAATLQFSSTDGATPEIIADQTAAFYLVEMTRAIAREIVEFRPDAVLTHPYEGGHPDHDSCAFAVHAAMRFLHRNELPAVIEAPFYHSRELWNPGGNGMMTGRFPPLIVEFDAVPIVYDLSPAERAHKAQRLACFTSQQQVLAQFGIEREQFRQAPRYDFTRPPHAGRLFYETFAWGMTGSRFRELAASALHRL